MELRLVEAGRLIVAVVILRTEGKGQLALLGSQLQTVYDEVCGHLAEEDVVAARTGIERILAGRVARTVAHRSVLTGVGHIRSCRTFGIGELGELIDEGPRRTAAVGLLGELAVEVIGIEHLLLYGRRVGSRLRYADLLGVPCTVDGVHGDALQRSLAGRTRIVGRNAYGNRTVAAAQRGNDSYPALAVGILDLDLPVGVRGDAYHLTALGIGELQRGGRDVDLRISPPLLIVVRTADKRHGSSREECRHKRLEKHFFDHNHLILKGLINISVSTPTIFGFLVNTNILHLSRNKQIFPPKI
ncbi:hypothetical protein IMSAGC022_00832 [Alistipes sp.]|nr:hypothetical protein IMSAGC022_00832 [Alistipes sp.]